MTVKIDDIDWQIILLLQQDGRMSARDISRKLGDITDWAVRYRIDKLVRTKAISIIAVVDNRVVGYPVLGDVIIEVPPARLRDRLAQLAEDELVCYLGADFERGVITIQIAARDEYEFNHWVRGLLANGDGATRVKTTVVREVTKSSNLWPPPRSDPDRPGAAVVMGWSGAINRIHMRVPEADCLRHSRATGPKTATTPESGIRGLHLY